MIIENEGELIENELIGKRVVIYKSDSYTKIGVLEELSTTFAKIKLDNGKVEYIPLAAISTIKLAEARR